MIMDTVKHKFQQMEQSGALKDKDSRERENLYKELTIAELRYFRSKLEKGNATMVIGADPDIIEMSECSKKPQCTIAPGHEEEIDWDPNTHLDEKEESRLLQELDNLESRARENERPMGCSIERIKSRTKLILDDLLENEVKKLGYILLHSNFNGEPVNEALNPILTKIQIKLLEYILEIVKEMLSYLVRDAVNESNPTTCFTESSSANAPDHMTPAASFRIGSDDDYSVAREGDDYSFNLNDYTHKGENSINRGRSFKNDEYRLSYDDYSMDDWINEYGN